MRNEPAPMTHRPHPFADLLGLRFVRRGKGISECALEATNALHNPQGVLHGAAFYALADTAMGGALYTLLEPGEGCATVQIGITYFAPVVEGELQCKCRVIHKGKRMATLEADLSQ